MASEELQHALRRVSGTTLDTAGAANVWAGSVGTTLVSQRTNLCTNPSFETGVASWLGYGSALTQSAVWAATAGGKSMAITPNSASNFSAASSEGAITPGIVAGNTYTISGTVNTPIAQTGVLHPDARAIAVITKVGAAAYVEVISPPGPATGSGRVSITFTAPVGMTECYVRPFNGADNSSANLVYWDEILIEQAPALGPYFDGATPPALLVTYAWAGAANASTSTRSIWTPGGLELVGALNKKAGTNGLDIDGVCNVLAGTPGQGKGINACAAAFV